MFDIFVRRADVDYALQGVEDPDFGDTHGEEVADANHGAAHGVLRGKDLDAEDGRRYDHLFNGGGRVEETKIRDAHARCGDANALFRDAVKIRLALKGTQQQEKFFLDVVVVAFAHGSLFYVVVDELGVGLEVEAAEVFGEGYSCSRSHEWVSGDALVIMRF